MQGSELKALRKEIGLSQVQLAAAIGMTQTYISMMERGTYNVEKRTELAVRYVAEHPELFSGE